MVLLLGFYALAIYRDRKMRFWQHVASIYFDDDPAYVPPSGGAWSPARYTTTFTYDYQESAAVPAEAADWGITVPPGLLGLGDVNFDGRTDQAGGQLVRRQRPVVTLLPGSFQAAAEGDTQHHGDVTHDE